MMVSTRGRYALRVMIDIAEHSNGNYVAMHEVADRQDISLKYLERILPMLVKAKLIEGVHGKGGGYHLPRKPAEYTVGEILRLTEGDLAPVSCLDCRGPECDRKEECRTLPMWEKIDKIVNDYFDSVTIEDLMYKDITANI